MTSKYHHLTYEQRCQIYALKKRGDTQSAIARELKVHRSTISRELKRNKGEKGYRIKQAQEKASDRRSKASRRPKKMTATTIKIIEKKLCKQWSPEQIAGFLKKQKYPKATSTETIYQHIWKRPCNDERQQDEAFKGAHHCLSFPGVSTVFTPKLF